MRAISKLSELRNGHQKTNPPKFVTNTTQNNLGACTNHVDRILGNFDPPSPNVDTFTKYMLLSCGHLSNAPPPRLSTWFVQAPLMADCLCICRNTIFRQRDHFQNMYHIALFFSNAPILIWLRFLRFRLTDHQKISCSLWTAH